ncbi:zinc finger protein gcs1 [Coccidioides immitis RS]|uniref:Zinc finger protein gcs1 n=4 Tax=Coccidioides immitis TaxID=5501 RepID=J3K7D5_COCIM|nr:zinc finger protein gcs1 [Coccidioides immitis RS]EAS30603.3 zinc finger protein gcs1 [Coccidioides immitis RS]KMP03156.1 ADP-ribosylation factor GTPase-activating protein 1 [Coccidioides immitis RMSCC 2394]KMU84732.1 ADP-ribosylation factor GTPase-activating protein 1 [Coccidioides immitis H538.4]TPX23535.1 Zn finger-containing GTPase- Activating Protein for ARF [Coccidioides immitis]
MSKLWEVDPETKSKLALIQKSKGNDRCCDCGAPSPQWASPKFGTFICLNCAGIHRGLGVHISFIRSITMDAFKMAEIQRMEHGGNESWKQFFDGHSTTMAEGTTFDDATIKERYSGDVGEEWKARLTAKVEGREYVPGEEKKNATSRTNTPGTLGSISPDQSRAVSPGDIGRMRSRKEQNEDYFAKLGGENAARSESLPPSQGGKYTGFGGGMPASRQTSQGDSIPGINDFQNDPVAALTKGFGWFTSTIGKSAKTVNDSYLQPAAKSLAESDLAAQARIAAAEVSRNIQSGARGASDSFNRFVEGPSDGSSNRSTSASRRFEPERKDFWDDFAALGESRSPPLSKSGAIGTAAMKKNTPTTTTTTTGSSTGGISAPKGKDDWDENW